MIILIFYLLFTLIYIIMEIKIMRISILFFSMKLNLYIIEQNINVIIYIYMYVYDVFNKLFIGITRQ